MCHASVTITEIQAEFSLSRLEMDFPSHLERPYKGRLFKPKWQLEFNENSLNNKYGSPFQNENSVIFIIKGFEIKK